MRIGIYGLASLFFLSSVSFVHSLGNPTLEFEASDSLQATVTRLERIDQSRFRESLDLVGLSRPGDPIRVVVAAEQSEWAHHAPIWASGYAIPRREMIVILPQRVVAYPYDSLENVLFHEVAHIFNARAARGQIIPRWFDEGLAMISARAWNFEDGARLTWAIVMGDPVSIETLDTLFREDQGSARKAYVLSHALVRFFIHEFGRDWPRKMFAFISKGVSFREAFFRTTFKPLHQAEADFWANQTVWTRWAPAVTSTIALWLGILGLALYVFRKQRQRAKALKRQWQEEDDFDL
ncbi:MAG: hypothetical protein JSU59_10190 [Nitrospirota bacterium]|nr:MAG: hypothetical protein JSU59_10190 [Nitrospirota bacterium]